MHPRRRCSCDRQRVPHRRARVGGLCGFRSPAERVPAESRKTGRCAGVRERCKKRQRRSKCLRNFIVKNFRLQQELVSVRKAENGQWYAITTDPQPEMTESEQMQEMHL